MPLLPASPLRDTCTRFLSYDAPRTAAEALRSLAVYAEDAARDEAGKGELVTRLEESVRCLLGKEAALFMPSGKAAQNIALRLWCERLGSNIIAVHPQSHTQQWEEHAYAELFGLRAVPFGVVGRQSSLDDVQGLPSGTGVASVELALRPLGCPVIPWPELNAIGDALRARGMVFHGDCARIWESQPFYGRSLADIAGCFDSVYVSLYKALGGLAGAVLAGPRWLIEGMRPWQVRMGQKLHGSFPYVLAALQGLEERLPLMPAFHSKAVEIAAAACRLPGVRVSPDPPHTNAFLLTVEGDASRADQARAAVARGLGLWLYDYVVPSAEPGSVTVEVHIWTAGLQVGDDELQAGVRLFREVLQG